jgi:hypothetical protein
MAAHQKTDPETERLVQEVKAEMINEGLIYTPPAGDKRYKKHSRYGEKIKPEFGNLLSSMCKPESLPDGIQFRGTPGRKRYEV